MILSSAMRNPVLCFWIYLILVFNFKYNPTVSMPLYKGFDTDPFKLVGKKNFKPTSSIFHEGFKSYGHFFYPKMKFSDEDWNYIFSEKMTNKLDYVPIDNFEWNPIYNSLPIVENVMKIRTLKNDTFSTTDKASSMGISKLKSKRDLAFLTIVLPLVAYSSLGPLLVAEILTALAIKRPRRLIRRKRQFKSSSSNLKEFMETTQKDLKIEVTDIRDDILATYLTCKGLTSTQNRCLERLACESTKYATTANPEDERAITVMLIDVMRNRKLKKTFKRRLSSAALLGRRHESNCESYQCPIGVSS